MERVGCQGVVRALRRSPAARPSATGDKHLRWSRLVSAAGNRLGRGGGSRRLHQHVPDVVRRGALVPQDQECTAAGSDARALPDGGTEVFPGDRAAERSGPPLRGNRRRDGDDFCRDAGRLLVRAALVASVNTRVLGVWIWQVGRRVRVKSSNITCSTLRCRSATVVSGPLISTP